MLMRVSICFGCHLPTVLPSFISRGLVTTYHEIHMELVQWNTAVNKASPFTRGDNTLGTGALDDRLGEKSAQTTPGALFISLFSWDSCIVGELVRGSNRTSRMDRYNLADVGQDTTWHGTALLWHCYWVEG